MARKTSTPKTAKIAKTAVRKSPSKPKESKDSDLKKQLLFLWTCLKVSDAHIDIPAVAQHFGIKNNAAQMRFTRLKKKLDAMEASPSSEDKKDSPKPMDEDQDDDAYAHAKEEQEEEQEEPTYQGANLEEQADLTSENE